MSVLLPKGLHWGVANWISFGFFGDAARHLDAAPQLTEKIRFCLDAEVDTLDLRDAGPVELGELRALVTLVLAETTRVGPSSFHDPAAHPTYVARLGELLATVEQALA